MDTTMVIDTLLQDLRYTFRTLRRDAGCIAFVILIAGFGIGTSSTVFSVANTLLLRRLPFADPAQLVWIANALDSDDSRGNGRLFAGTPRVKDRSDGSASF
jgi:hypothetical protein